MIYPVYNDITTLYLCLNNWGQPYIVRRRVKMTTYSQELQKFSVHVEMYCISWASTANECILSTQSLKENFRRCISQWLHLCNDLFTAVSHKCQSNTFSVTKHFHFNIFSLAVNDSIYCCITEVVRTF